MVVASVLGWLIGILTTHSIRPGLYSYHYVTALIFYRYTPPPSQSRKYFDDIVLT